jgi:hypothetical protein
MPNSIQLLFENYLSSLLTGIIDPSEAQYFLSYLANY